MIWCVSLCGTQSDVSPNEVFSSSIRFARRRSFLAVRGVEMGFSFVRCGDTLRLNCFLVQNSIRMDADYSTVRSAPAAAARLCACVCVCECRVRVHIVSRRAHNKCS